MAAGALATVSGSGGVARHATGRAPSHRPRASAVLLALAALAACGPIHRRQPAPPPGAALRVGTSGDYPPFSYRRSDGTLDGFDVAVARRYAADRGRAVVFTPFRWPELRARLLAGELDVAMSGITVRADRLVDGLMTPAVARAQAVLVTTPARGLRAAMATPPEPPGGTTSPEDARLAAFDRAGIRVAVNRGGHLERVARARLRHATIVPLDDNRLLPCALRDGTADALVTDTLELAAFPRVDERTCAAPPPGRDALRAAGATSFVTVACLADDRKAYWLPPSAADLAADLDDWLRARERDGTLAAIRARYFGEGRGCALERSAGAALRAADADLVDLVGRRLLLMPLVFEAKHAAGLPIEDRAREDAVERVASERATAAGLDGHAYRGLARAEIDAAKAIQRAADHAERHERALARERARAHDRHPGERAGVAPVPAVAGSGRSGIAPLPAPGERSGDAAAPALPALGATPALPALRAAIDRLDAAILAAAARAVPVAASPAALAAALRRDAGVPGVGDDALRDLARALTRLRRVSRDEGGRSWSSGASAR